MKILIYRIVVCLIIILGMFFTYDVYLIITKLNKELLNKFELNILLDEQQNVDSIIEDIRKSENEKFQFRQIRFFSKEELFEEIRKEQEFLPILEVIEKNPFSNYIKITFSKFSQKDFDKFISNIKNVKEIIFDETLKLYLSKINFFLDVLYLFIVICIVLTVLSIILGLLVDFDKRHFILKAISILFIFSIFVKINNYILEKFVDVKFLANWFDFLFIFLTFVLCLVLFNRK